MCFSFFVVFFFNLLNALSTTNIYPSPPFTLTEIKLKLSAHVPLIVSDVGELNP